MLGWLIAGLLVGAAVITIVVSYLDYRTAQKKLKEQFGSGVQAFVRSVTKDGSKHTIKMDALDDEGTTHEVEFQADEVEDIHRGDVIYT